MKISTKLAAAMIATAMALSLQTGSAKAQFSGFEDNPMAAQAAPMLDKLKAKMGAKRYGQLMSTMGPMMANMMGGEGGGGGFGGMGGGMGDLGSMFGGGGMGGMDMGSMMAMMGPMMSGGGMGSLMGGGGSKGTRRSRRR